MCIFENLIFFKYESKQGIMVPEGSTTIYNDFHPLCACLLLISQIFEMKKNAQRGSEISEHYHWHMDKFWGRETTFLWNSVMFAVTCSIQILMTTGGEKVILKNLYDFFRIFLHRYPTDHCIKIQKKKHFILKSLLFQYFNIHNNVFLVLFYVGVS